MANNGRGAIRDEEATMEWRAPEANGDNGGTTMTPPAASTVRPTPLLAAVVGGSSLELSTPDDRSFFFHNVLSSEDKDKGFGSL